MFFIKHLERKYFPFVVGEQSFIINDTLIVFF